MTEPNVPHEYFHSGITDKAKMMEDAQKRLVDYRYPEESIVHDHRQGQPCNDKCITYKRIVK